MAKRTAKEIFRAAKIDAARYVEEDDTNVVIYMSGSAKMKSKLDNLLTKYITDSHLDFGLGIIDEKRFAFETKVAEILERSIAEFHIY